ncbi:MAG: thioredoxin-dependent thiol peroxidase [Candidatus Micrarchaeota archaeon]
MLSVGSKAPEFSLKAQDGKTYSLKKLAGKRAVLYFYPKDDTPGCTIESCGFRDHNAQFIRAGAQILGISADDAKSHGKFALKYGLNFPLLADMGAKVCKKYGVWKEKNFLGRKFMGIERTTFLINGQGRIAAIFPKVNPLGHAKGMLSVLSMIKDKAVSAPKANSRKLPAKKSNPPSKRNH